MGFTKPIEQYLFCNLLTNTCIYVSKRYYTREEIECSLKTLYLLTSRFDRKLCSRGNKNGYNFLYSI